MPIYEPSCHDGSPSSSSSWSKGTTRHSFVIQPLVDRVVLPSDANDLQNTYYARALLGAVIATTILRELTLLLKRDHKRLLEEGLDVRFLINYTQQDHHKGWRVFRVYENIKHINFPPPQHLLDEMSDLEAEKEECDLEGNPAPDAPGESFTLFKGKDVPIED
ncbi:hypothetical protein C1H46_023089 [Malus baccata]|uniref:Uncharacterized protein n=1 Tax=Malus baccata TaxID=106549 RepID=A0A540LY25_MALBA|nr:hypothetical protein C1H46_023089 [Malus baccata]